MYVNNRLEVFILVLMYPNFNYKRGKLLPSILVRISISEYDDVCWNFRAYLLRVIGGLWVAHDMV